MTADQRLNQVIRESCITLIILVRLLQQKLLALRDEPFGQARLASYHPRHRPYGTGAGGRTGFST
jgi:hypothetical protein